MPEIATPTTHTSIVGVTGTFSGAVSMTALTATTGTFSGAVSGITTLATSSNLTVGGTAAITGAVTLSSTLAVTGTSRFTDDIGGTTTFGPTSQTSGTPITIFTASDVPTGGYALVDVTLVTSQLTGLFWVIKRPSGVMLVVSIGGNGAGSISGSNIQFDHGQGGTQNISARLLKFAAP